MNTISLQVYEIKKILEIIDILKLSDDCRINFIEDRNILGSPTISIENIGLITLGAETW